MNKSFTLIEILVVIVVIGIISSFIIVGLSSVSDKANIAKGQVFSNSLRNSLLMNLVSEWKLDGNANDSWGINNGTWHGSGGSYASPSWRTSSECVSGGCLAFDGTDDYINCGNNVLIGYNSFTFSFWAKTSRNSVIQSVLRRNASITGLELQFQIPRSGTANALFIVTNSSYPTGFIYRYVDPNTSNTNTINNKWHYFVGSCDRSQHKPPDVYFDGVFSNGAYYGYCDQLIDNIQPDAFMIGGNGSYFQGLIDEVIVYNSATSIVNVQSNYFSDINKLFKNKGIVLNEFNQRLTELKNNLSKNY